ncbi:hypothetical protein [Paraburkholderia panacisoli]|uniref:hypothetical protein n=1 Tax=Paraburkholderia panacisoli TaxID=2603818 RepID=UPI00165FAEFE
MNTPSTSGREKHFFHRGNTFSIDLERRPLHDFIAVRASDNHRDRDTLRFDDEIMF